MKLCHSNLVLIKNMSLIIKIIFPVLCIVKKKKKSSDNFFFFQSMSNKKNYEIRQNKYLQHFNWLKTNNIKSFIDPLRYNTYNFRTYREILHYDDYIFFLEIVNFESIYF